MSKKYNWVWLTLVLGATYLLYVPSLRFEFVFDDRYQIVQNQHLASWSYLPVYFTQHVWSQEPGAITNFYRPLFLVWLRLNLALFGAGSTAWHFTTILLHLIATGLVYVLGRKLSNDLWTALLAALLFGIHPVHVEAVAWISGVTEPLSVVLVLGAFLCYLASLADNLRPLLLWRASALLLFALALLAKESAATLPVLILLYELVIRRQDADGPPVPTKVALGKALGRVMPFLVLIAVYLVARAFALGSVVLKTGNTRMLDSVLRLPWILCAYIRLFLWPVHLSPLYDPVTVNRLTDPRFWLSALILLAGSCFLWICRKWQGFRTAFFLTGWFLITLGPVLVFSCVGKPWELFEDRYMYLPSVALVIMAAAGIRLLFRAGNPIARIATVTATVALVLALGVASRKQISYWENNYTLFERANTIAPHNEIANANLVHELVKQAEYPRAWQLAQQGLVFNPESARANESAGGVAYYLKNFVLADRYLSAASRINPGEEHTWQYLGLSRLELGDYAGAAVALENAIALDRHKDPNLHYSRGLALSKLNHWSMAKEEFHQELDINPNNQAALVAYKEADAHLQ